MVIDGKLMPENLFDIVKVGTEWVFHLGASPVGGFGWCLYNHTPACFHQGENTGLQPL